MENPATPPESLEINYPAEVLEKELRAAALDFTESIRAGGGARLFGANLMSRVASAGTALEDRLSSPFTIMVTGDFKRGKSTLINTLVSQAVAPVDVRPETISINRIEYAPEFVARLQCKDGGEAVIDRDDLRRDRLEPLFARYPGTIRHLRIGVPAEVLRGVTLIDTPGLGDMFREFEPLVSEYIDQVDTIVYVLSSSSPLSHTEQDFLLASIAPRNFLKVFFVVNAVDIFNSDADERRVLDLIRAKLHRIMPGSSLYGISALDEWSRVSGGARPQPARSASLEKQYALFRGDLDAAIQFRHRYFVLDRAAHVLSETVELIEQRAIGIRAALQQDAEQLDAAVHALEQGRQTKSKEIEAAADALAKGFDRLRREADGWMSAFIDRLANGLANVIPHMKVSQIRQHLPFFMKDRLRRALEACVLAHEPEIAKLLDEYAAGNESKIGSLLLSGAHGAVEQAQPVAEARWTTIQTAQLLVQYLPGGGLLQAGLGFFSRQQADTQSAELADSLARNIPALRNEVSTTVREAYAGVKDKLVAEWTRHHDEELKQRLEDLKQAVRLREEGAQRVDSAQSELAALHQSIGAKKAFLAQFRNKVAAGMETGGADV